MTINGNREGITDLMQSESPSLTPSALCIGKISTVAATEKTAVTQRQYFIMIFALTADLMLFSFFIGSPI